MTDRPHRKRGARAATLADVGRLAGVSATAASAALNDTRTSARISEETRAKILTAASQLGYRPNIAARALVNRRMNTIGMGVVFENQELNHYFLEVFNGVIEGANHRGQNTTVFTFSDWFKDIGRVASACDGRIDGMLLVGPTFTAETSTLLPEHTPIVALHANRSVPGILNIETDEERGAHDLTSHLIQLGHRRIMHISGSRGLTGAERRIRGYQQALEDAGIAFDPNLLLSSRFSGEAASATLRSWLERNVGEQLPQAIFCANDTMAIACVELLVAEGLRVPDDISVCGFDDTLAARTISPQLTTVRQPLRQMGYRAVELLLERVESGLGRPTDEEDQSIIFQTSGVYRGSTSRPGPERVVQPLKPVV